MVPNTRKRLPRQGGVRGLDLRERDVVQMVEDKACAEGGAAGAKTTNTGCSEVAIVLVAGRAWPGPVPVSVVAGAEQGPLSGCYLLGG